MTKSAVAYWVAQFNASQTALATRTSERDSARNAIYVSGVYASGPSWQTQDATDVASGASALAAEVALYNASQATLATRTAERDAALAAAAAKTTTTVSTTSFSGTWTNSTTVYSGTLATLTAPRTGHGQVAAIVRINSSIGAHGQARILVNGSVVATGTQTGHNSSSGTVAYSVAYQGNFNSGDTVTVQVASDGNTTLNSGEFFLTVGSL